MARGQRSKGYEEFLQSKEWNRPNTGLEVVPDLHPQLFLFQRDITAWALRKGRASVFADCGLGKTLIQLEWADKVPGDVLVLAPLAVTRQTKAEADRFGYDNVEVSRDGCKVGKITITNYQRLHRFDPGDYSGVVLDESSIIKSFDGKTRNDVIDMFCDTPFKLACTATPAPNDHMELGNHSEFMGVLTRAEMLATFFCHDGGNTSQWRLKRHAVEGFWKWVASWAVMLRMPSDLGYSDSGFALPGMRIHEHVLASGVITKGMLFTVPELTLNGQRSARRKTMADRVGVVADLVNGSGEPWVVWCELNDEGDLLHEMIEGSVQVAGADSNDVKESRLLGFASGKFNVLVSKPKIAGFGMNWQHCNKMVFVGLSHSWEAFYQAVRRCWRFGQEKLVDVHVVSTDIESAVLDNIKRKQASADEMAERMVGYMSEETKRELSGSTMREFSKYKCDTSGDEDTWVMHHADCIDAIKDIDDCSIDYTVFSPPFASLYTYSDSDRDMGNCKGMSEFMEHFSYLVPEMLRVTKTGRLLSFHCMQLPFLKQRDGFIGLQDFRGALTKMFTDAGWIFHSEVCIWKDPVTQMQRTKALGLLHKQIKKDSTMSRQGLPDYLVTMRKPGQNAEPVIHTNESFPVDRWQRWASPVWMDIKQSDTLQYMRAREERDERHIAPLQLEVIQRAIRLWTNEGDVVLSPFAGIGSEGYVALREGRRFVGIELKESYWKRACINLEGATAQKDLFSESV